MNGLPWTWTYADADGSAIEPDDVPQHGFATQADAETWVGEAWRSLLAQGVESVSLLEGDTVVYGPMSLRAPE